MTDWDSEDFDPDIGFQKPAVGDKWEGEDEDDIKDAWDDEDETAGKDDEKEKEEGGDSESAKAFQVKKKKKTKLEETLKKKEEKRKEKLEQLQKEEEPAKEELTPPEEQLADKLRQEQLQKDADLELTKEMFDVQPTLAEDSLDALNPTTKEQFDRFAKLLKVKLETLESSPFYVDFLEDVMKDCCINLDTDYVKRIGNSLTAIATEKAKAQKAAVKGKKKSKKGVLVGSSKAGNRDEFDAYNDMEDFV